MTDDAPSDPDRDFTHDGPGTPATLWTDDHRWTALPESDLTPGSFDRVVVAAAHPDDESLGAGGLVTRLHRSGIPVTLLVATAGEHSHPRSSTTNAVAMAARRRTEVEAAWAALDGADGSVVQWGLPDGDLTAREDDLVNRLVDVLGDGRRTLLVTPWRHDGHPDHDTLGRAGRRAAFRTGAALQQYPVWFWHRSTPDQAPWPLLTRLRLTEDDRAAKAAAVASHRSQVSALSDQPGDEVLLGPAMLAHFTGDQEVFVAEPPADDTLDDLHEQYADPWGTQTRFYEARKRELLLALLPRPRFDRGLDVGCSTGTLTESLAGRCAELVAVDRSRTAIRVAQQRLAGADGVQVAEMAVPDEWPDGSFDLVVISESAYFLSPPALDRLVERVAGSLRPDGCLVLAHWRHALVGWPLSGPQVHPRFRDAPAIPDVAARYVDRDVELVLHAAPGALPDPGGS